MINTPSMIVSPSIILLQPHVGRFHASDQEKISISADCQAMFGQQVGVWHHVGAAIVVVWVYNKLMNTPSMIVSPSIILLQPHVGRFHASDQEKISIFCRLSDNVWPTSGGMASCRCCNSGCLALYGCVTS